MRSSHEHAAQAPARKDAPRRRRVIAARTRTFSWQDPAATAAAGLKLAGLDYIRAIVDGTLPPPPIAELFGFEIVEAEHGRAVFAMEPAEWMYNPIGMVHGGVAATLLDSCMGCAVHTTLEAGVGYTTTDLQVRYIRAMSERQRPRARRGPRRARRQAHGDRRGAAVRRVGRAS